MLILTDSNFDEELKKAPVLVVDFYADWCGPCKMMAPVFEELDKEMTGRTVFGKLDVDSNNNSAIKYQTMSIPTTIFFKNGKEVKRTVGYQDKMTLTKIISEVI